MRYTFPLAALSAALLLTLSACGKPEQTPAAPTQPAASAPAAEAPAPAETPASETAEPAADDGVVTHFKANGNSPAWNAEVKDDTITFEVPDFINVDSPKHTVTVERLAYAKGVNYDGKDGDVAFTLDINSKECDKTGEKREFTATLTYGQNTYHGCADALR